MTMMRQEALFPELLSELLSGLEYRDGWRFRLIDGLDRGQGSVGLTLVITISGPDSYHPDRLVSVNHYMPVPPAAFDARSWRRWLFEQVGLVELHERMEWFRIFGERSYAPSHGPGNDPYLVRELGTDTDRRMSFRGELNPIRPGALREIRPGALHGMVIEPVADSSARPAPTVDRDDPREVDHG